jgi:hypothetical protein
MKKRLAGILGFIPLLASAALPTGDTQGVVAAVRVMVPSGGVHSFQVWFASASNDRWSCVQSNGYVIVSESTLGMTSENYKRIFAIALAAQASGKALALDSASTNPCTSANVAWMVD